MTSREYHYHLRKRVDHLTMMFRVDMAALPSMNIEDIMRIYDQTGVLFYRKPVPRPIKVKEKIRQIIPNNP